MLEVIESAIHRVKLKGKDIWTRYSYWTKAKDVEFETGKNAEETVANINQDISDEITRATNAENALDSKLNSEISRAKNAENTITTNLNAEITRAKNVESTLESKKANIESPTLTGTPKAPTATAGTNTTQIATTAFVRTEINNLINSAPEKADTLKELFDLIEDNTDATDALNAAIGTKANKSDLTDHINNTTVHITATERTNWNDANSKKHTHSNKSILDAITASYTTEEKTKLSGVATGANNYVLPTASSTLGGVKTTSTVTSSSGYTACPIISGVPYYKNGDSTTYSIATDSVAGIGKLYAGTGTNTDGSITQSAISTELGKYLPLAGGTVDYLNVSNTAKAKSLLLYLDDGATTVTGMYHSATNEVIYSSSGFNKAYSSHILKIGSSSGSMYGSGTHFDLDTQIRGRYIALEATKAISSSVSIVTSSDEKVKSFTEDIEADEEKLVKLFDIIKPKSYSYKYVKSDSLNGLNIGFSAQEIEQAMIDLGIDPEKYGILNIQYGHILSRGNDFEDGKYYTKFYEISYNDLFNLSLLKTHMMEKEHVERLNSLEARLSALEK